MKMSKEQKKKLAKQIAVNTALAGLGTGAGYFTGGAALKALSSSPKFRKTLMSLSPAKKKAILSTLKYGGTAAGTAAGGLATYSLMKSMGAEEKVASFCTSLYLRYV